MIHAERVATEAKEWADKASASSCWPFADRSHEQEAVDHSMRVARLIEALGESGAGCRAALRAITEMQGLSEEETEDIISGKRESKVNVPHSLRSALCSIGLGDMLAPVNIFTIAGDTEAILLKET